MDDFENISLLVMNGGDITVGRMGPVACAATASDEDQCLAMLARRPGESFFELLARLDAAVLNAVENQVFADEINA
ncbi:MAG TPA: hypothetical protein VFJ15_15145 [Oleiagrimonas sp.]|nr:hypothetical protein [Oleiagrimonas sp.]